MKDERFSPEPLYANGAFGHSSYNESLSDKSSNWLKNTETGEIYLDNSKRYYLDAKFGIMFYFKNKPSFLASFNFDNEGNLYIYQIQAQYKSRGHYRLGERWREMVVNYIKESFSHFKIHLIDGKASALLSTRGYKGEHEKYKPSKQKQKQIASTYDNLFPESKDYVSPDGIRTEHKENNLKFRLI